MEKLIDKYRMDTRAYINSVFGSNVHMQSVEGTEVSMISFEFVKLHISMCIIYTRAISYIRTCTFLAITGKCTRYSVCVSSVTSQHVQPVRVTQESTSIPAEVGAVYDSGSVRVTRKTFKFFFFFVNCLPPPLLSPSLPVIPLALP